MLHLRRHGRFLTTHTGTFIRNYNVTVVGGGTEIGQTVSLMLKAQPLITKLTIHDVPEETAGVILDLSHIPTETSLKGFTGEETLERALKGSDIVIATGGLTEKPGLAKRTWLETNTEFIKILATKLSKVHPMPFVAIVTEPINALVPMVSEIMRNNGDFDSKKLFGVTTIDSLRAQSLYAIENGLNPRDCYVPVIGGHSDKTTIPLLSQAKPVFEMSEKRIQELTGKIKKSTESVMQAKKGWSPTLSIAYSVLIFTRGLLNALDGCPSKVNAFMENNDFGTSYFSGAVTVDKNGAVEMQRYSNISQYECHLLERSIELLRKDVARGKKILELV
ncbi:malate dehydrogenase [Aphomia sociella]